MFGVIIRGTYWDDVYGNEKVHVAIKEKHLVENMVRTTVGTLLQHIETPHTPSGNGRNHF